MYTGYLQGVTSSVDVYSVYGSRQGAKNTYLLTQCLSPS